MPEMYPKRGKQGSTKGFQRYALGRQVKVETTEFYEAQNRGMGSAAEESTRANLYGKPGTTTHARQPEPYEVTFPITRYRSIRP